ncbi:MAG: DUF1330 domain-containing protein, partial [Janthinobacterium lividum]
MKGYMVVVYRQIADEETMQAYAGLALPALMALGARFLIRTPGEAVDARESGLCERVVVIEFPTKEQAIAAYDSEAYQAAVSLLAGKVDRDVRFVEALCARTVMSTPCTDLLTY